MLLNSLDISGFKSFARPARLEFPSGITALVGPNGSGKSNVVDAVRWSLGEQSARDLRGQRSEDVIFAGARKVLGAAEVALTFEEAPGVHDETRSSLSVSRRLYRSGESEYLVDGQRVRLRDVIHELNAIGVDAGRHIIVTQGMADALLTAGPAERRMLLEQAAGLSAYRQRREEARQKLSVIEQNIETVEVVLQEVEPRVKLLRRQVKAMEDRDEAVRRLRERLAEWHGWRSRVLRDRRDRAESHERSLAIQRAGTQTTVAGMEQTYRTVVESERKWQKQLESDIYALHQAERERDAQIHALELLEQRHAEFSRERSRLQAQMRQCTELQQDARAHLSAAQGVLAAADREKSEHDAILHRLRTARTEAQSRLRASEETVASHKRQVAKMEQDEHHAARRNIDAKRDLDQCLSDSLRLRDRSEELIVEAESFRAQRDVAQMETSKTSDRVRSIGDQLAVQNRVASSLRTRSERVARVRARAAHVMVSAQSRLDATRIRLDALLGDQSAGVLAKLNVSIGHEHAVAAALDVWARAGVGGEGQSILHVANMREFLGWRESLHIPSGAGSWLDSAVTGFPSSHVNPLSATFLVAADVDAGRIWAELEGQLAGAIGWPGIQVVTHDGRVWNAIGVRTNCRVDAAEYFAVKRDEEELARQVGVRRDRLLQIETLAMQTEADLEQARENVRRNEEQLRIASSQHADAEAVLQRVHRSLSRIDNECTRCATDLERLTRETVVARATLAAAETEIQQMNDAVAKARSGLAMANVANHENRKDVSSLSDQLIEEERLGVILDARFASAADRVKSAEINLRQISNGDADHTARMRQVDVANQNIVTDMERGRDVLVRVNDALRQRQNAVDMRKSSRPASVQPDESLQQARDQLSELVSRHERALSQLSQAQEQLTRWQEEAMRDLGGHEFTLPDCVDNPPTDEEIRRLRSRAGQYADLDDSVTEEWNRLEARQAYLRAQLHDLVVATDELRQIMRLSDEEMQLRFRDAFDAVNQEFSRVFQVMLRGGDAQLELIGTEQHVDIRAQLPGRRSRSSAAFSGGERSLVALSLLFGVLRIKPAPFCILDEVDAALDENNVDRYLAVLRDLSESTQMIVVTHNRATMAAADVLYGLTMDDAGASSVLSLRLDQYQAG